MWFIGGRNIHELHHTIKGLNKLGMLSIVDYAKEGSKTAYDVIRYLDVMKETIHKTNEAFPETAYALKYSSFRPFVPYKSMSYLIQKMGPNAHIFLDAEDSNSKAEEDSCYYMLLAKYKTAKLYKTYQMYRYDSLNELKRDLVMYPNLGVKLVRGAYHMKQDKDLFQSKKETDDNYNAAVELLLTTNHPNINICFATHNKESIHLAIEIMKYRECHNNISFAQLLDMADDVSTNLVKNGHKVFKYVPFGNPIDTFPYLFRRLKENVGILQHVKPKKLIYHQ